MKKLLDYLGEIILMVLTCQWMVIVFQFCLFLGMPCILKKKLTNFKDAKYLEIDLEISLVDIFGIFLKFFGFKKIEKTAFH
jgi:hypothetical protein